MRALALTSALAAAAALAAAPGLAAAQSPPEAELTTFVKQTRELSPDSGTPSQRRGLAAMASAARRSAKTGHTCSAIELLARYRRIVERVAVENQPLAQLATDSVVLTETLLSLPSTKRCGGGIEPSTLPEPRTTVLQSNTRVLKLKVELPDLRFVARTGLGQAWTKLVLPLTDVSDPGEPGIPVAGAAFGVPSGASVSVETRSADTYAIDDVTVFPAQPQTADQVTPPPNFSAPPFTGPRFAINPRGAYDDRRAVPPRLSKASVLGTMRDVRIGRLEVPSAQWNPSTGRLRVVKSVRVTIRFSGGSGRFSRRVASPWEAPQRSLVSGLVNADAVRGLAGAPAPAACGEEMLVITNPATLAAANQLADARRAAGIRTTVAQTGGAVGTTPRQIQRYIRGRLRSPDCVRPSYVTILGDDALVPPFHSLDEPFPPEEGEEGRIASDLPYSTRNDADELPDVAIGRVLGRDQAAVASAVTKIVRYETSPPGGPMLNRATVAAMFQDDDDDGTEDRTFIQYAEIVRAGLVARGMEVDRIYHDDFATAPRALHDGTELPADLIKPGYAWRGDGQEVANAWNEGRSLIFHRDHGWSDGWGKPEFDTAQVQALANGERLPVVLSINCSSGAYDRDETSFAEEALVKPDGGAVGVFGDTRDSPSSHNTQLALGFADALLPNVLGAEGPTGRQRMGNALTHGKLRLAGRWPPATADLDSGDELTQAELHMWHYFGDPSMQVWGAGEAPVVLDSNAFGATLVRRPQGAAGPPYEVRVTLPPGLDGQTVSLLRGGQPIGKAFAAGGAATIAAPSGGAEVDAGELRIALEPDGSPPVSAPVDD